MSPMGIHELATGSKLTLEAHSQAESIALKAQGLLQGVLPCKGAKEMRWTLEESQSWRVSVGDGADPTHN